MEYQIIRIYFKGETKQNSVEYRDDLLQASQRFYNIIAADLGNAEVTYQATYLKDKFGHDVLAPVVYDRTANAE